MLVFNTSPGVDLIVIDELHETRYKDSYACD
jgi:hypothetical protein